MSTPHKHEKHHEESRPEPHRSLVVHYLERSERIVLTLIAVVLVVLAILLLLSNIVGMIQSVLAGSMGDKAIEILDGVLLVMMTMEIVYTVTLSLQSHKLVAEPFLVIGIIAAIRRTLVITAESTKLEDKPELFRSTLLELALLSVIVGVMAVSIYVMRRSNRFVGPDDETKLLDD
jgi:uncharacterized membrane protein (DUF373 family)